MCLFSSVKNNHHIEIMPLKPFYSTSNALLDTLTNDTEQKKFLQTNPATLDAGTVKMMTSDSNRISESDWVVFEGVDQEREKDETCSNDVLSTRTSSHWSPQHSKDFKSYLEHDQSSKITDDYVISDFHEDVEAGDETDTDEEVESDDNDSLINDVRCNINSVHELKLSELKNKQQLDLVNKINHWKSNIETNLESSVYHKTSKKLRPSKSELLKIKKTLNKLYKEIENDRYKKQPSVKHEGIFMHNPDLERCIPNYWKTVMLDNLLKQAPPSNENSTPIDSKPQHLKKRNFWQSEESGSIQSTSTGWDGSILGF